MSVLIENAIDHGAGGKRGQRKRQTRAALLVAARELLRRQGYAGLTSRDVTRLAGVSAGTFFVHFPSTGALVEALLDEHLAAALDECARTLPRGGLIRQLLHVARGLYDSYDVEPELSREYLAAALFRPEPGGVTEARLRQFEGWVEGLIAAAVAAGKVPPVDPRLAFGWYFSLYFGLLVAGLRGQASRAQQLELLEAGLRRLFKLEGEP